jgi:hypothetical protein
LGFGTFLQSPADPDRTCAMNKSISFRAERSTVERSWDCTRVRPRNSGHRHPPRGSGTQPGN